jgi:hypothetical protein
VHPAPPLRVSLGRGRAWPVFIGACVGAAMGNAMGWVLLASQTAPALPVALLTALVTGTLSAWRTHRLQAAGDLSWDGAQWQWLGNAGQANAVIDLDRWMLLRFEPNAGRPRWLAASRAACIGSWSGLRAALYARRPADPLA